MNRFSILLFLSLFFISCNTINLYEKNVVIPGHEWRSDFRPSFEFTITDTTALYNVMVVLRHNDRYGYNNIWLNLGVTVPGDSTTVLRIEKPLATNAGGWLGTGMDDIYEHRIPVNDVLAREGISFRKSGTYSFTLEQIMREDPLKHVMNAGIRVEKK